MDQDASFAASRAGRAMDQHDLETGVEIGDFRIERRLGAGGMGIVYRARQVSLDRTVALKVLGAALSREADRMRFHREAQAIAKLHHPGIAGVYFIGQDRHVCYIAMEFIDGLSLREVIDRLAASHDPALTIDLASGSPVATETRTRGLTEVLGSTCSRHRGTTYANMPFVRETGDGMRFRADGDYAPEPIATYGRRS